MTTALKPYQTCISCGLSHEDVEAGGIWYCPNPLCRVSGATNHRMRLKSFKDHGGHHTVDNEEWLRRGLIWAVRTRDYVILRAALKRALKMLDEIEAGEETPPVLPQEEPKPWSERPLTFRGHPIQEEETT